MRVILMNRIYKEVLYIKVSPMVLILVAYLQDWGIVYIL